MRNIFLIVATIYLCSACDTENASENTDNTFTFSKGVNFIDSSECNENLERKIEIDKNNKGYLVKINGFFPYQGKLETPELMDIYGDKATLAIIQKQGSFGFFKTDGGCTRSLSVQISGRLRPGQVLYISNDREVMGHLIVPQ